MNSRVVVYMRVSTDSQQTAQQEMVLKQRYPNGEYYEEVASGGKTRPILKRIVLGLESGDTLVAYSLDRLGRKTVEILQMIESLALKGVNLITIREGVDYSTIAGKLVTQILCSIAEMERSLISERTKMALDVKRLAGIVGGRPRTTDVYLSEIIKLRESGCSFKEIGHRLGIAASSVCVAYNRAKKVI